MSISGAMRGAYWRPTITWCLRSAQ